MTCDWFKDFDDWQKGIYVKPKDGITKYLSLHLVKVRSH